MHKTIGELLATWAGISGFVLSIINLYLQRRDKVVRCKVRLERAQASQIKLGQVELVYDRRAKLFKDIVPAPSWPNPYPIMSLSIVNVAEKPVTVYLAGIEMPNGKYICVETDPEPTPNQPDPMPVEIAERKSSHNLINPKSLAKSLRANGFSGRIRIRGFYRDGLRRKFYSKSIFFDTEEFPNA
jgi:hypothetical protein